MHTLYIPTKASSLTKGWSLPVFGMLSSGALSSILFPLTELLCARSSDSAFSCIMINKNKKLLEIVLYLSKKCQGKNYYEIEKGRKKIRSKHISSWERSYSETSPLDLSIDRFPQSHWKLLELVICNSKLA